MENELQELLAWIRARREEFDYSDRDILNHAHACGFSKAVIDQWRIVEKIKIIFPQRRGKRKPMK